MQNPLPNGFLPQFIAFLATGPPSPEFFFCQQVSEKPKLSKTHSYQGFQAIQKNFKPENNFPSNNTSVVIH